MKALAKARLLGFRMFPLARPPALCHCHERWWEGRGQELGRLSVSLSFLFWLALELWTISLRLCFLVYEIRVSSIGMWLVIWFNHKMGLHYVGLKESINVSCLTALFFTELFSKEVRILFLKGKLWHQAVWVPGKGCAYKLEQTLSNFWKLAYVP